jgi:hypothetical protein
MKEAMAPLEVDQETMPIAASEHFATGRGARALWAGILLPPLAFLTAMEVAYVLVPWACQKGRHGVVWLGLIPGVVMLAVGAWSAFNVRRELGSGLGHEVGGIGGGVAIDPSPSRARFMATLGVLSSVLFLLLMIALAIPIAVLHPCD